MVANENIGVRATHSLQKWQSNGSRTSYVCAMFFPQSVARSYEEQYQEVSEELKALNGVKQKLSSLEEEIQSLLKANKV